MSVKRTYGSRTPRPSSTLFSSSPPAPQKRKRPLLDILCENNPPRKKNSAASSKPQHKPKVPRKSLTQLHFCIDATTLRTCPLCELSYTKGAPDDESLHKAHCARVQRGLEWGREEEKEKDKASVDVVDEAVRLKTGERGRIISFRADVTGKVGAKLAILLETINLTLCSPPLPPATLRASKAYLFLTPTHTAGREKIVGCVIAQRISSAMAVSTVLTPTATPLETTALWSSSPTSDTMSIRRLSASDPSETISHTLVHVDTGLYCDPTPLPTPLGIPRLFVASSYRRKGIAHALLDTTARTFIHGCALDPRKGEVAFSQPTGMGRAIMEDWGKGGVRIFEE